MMFKATPNPGHVALARLVLPQLRHSLASDASFTLITQSKEHGVASHFSSRLLRSRHLVLTVQFRELNLHPPIYLALAGTELVVEGKDDSQTAPVLSNSTRDRRGLLRRREQCGAPARPDVVFFTEVPHRTEEVMRLVDNADVLIAVGTSAVVHPAATLSVKVKEHGGTVAVFDIEHVKRDDIADFVSLGSCEDIFPRVLAVPDSN
ncbi:DHS-like NAD/FAD-binding domain-containing protein [Trametes punicea]|nr:DHS-like NAD/FAD-binding domain-containing protein [Trametes punicea]